MNDHDALLAAILANQDEDTPRLIYADWLDEHGDAPRAEFIRVQVELARLNEANANLPTFSGMWDPRSSRERTLQIREAELLEQNAKRWTEGLPKYAANTRTKDALRFRRGFVGHVQTSLGTLMKDPMALWERHPIESLELMQAFGAARLKVPACQQLAALRELHFLSTGNDPDRLSAFTECPYLSGLRFLDVGREPLADDDAVRILARSPHLRPRGLELDGNYMSASAFTMLLHSAFVSRLHRLKLNRHHPCELESIAQAPLTELRFLAWRSSLGGLLALIRAQHLTQLIGLDLRYSDLTDAAVESLATWPGLAGVRVLTLHSNEGITGRGIAALVRSPYFRPRYLDLMVTRMCDSGAKELAAWSGLPDLIALNVWSSGLTETGILALADAPGWRDVRHINAAGNLGNAVGHLRERFRARFADQPVEIFV